MSRLRSGLCALALILCVVWFGSVEQSAAQKDSPPKDGPVPKGTLPANWKKLGLSSDQVKQVYRIEYGYRGKIDALKQQIEELRKAQKGELEKVLTPAQKERLKEIVLGPAPKDAPKDKAPPKDAAPKDAAPKDTAPKDKDKK